MHSSKSSRFKALRRLGKSQARQEFGPLVESVAAGKGLPVQRLRTFII